MVPVSYSATTTGFVLILLVLGVTFLAIGLAAMALLLLRRQRDTNTAVDRLSHMIASPEQAWFWTPEWQAGEAEAEADIASGRTVAFSSDEEFDAYLDQLDAEADEQRKAAA